MPQRLAGLKPVVDRKARILILGSFPGAMSLKKRQYYANKQNHFWNIMSDLFCAEKRRLSYAEKIRLLKKNRIALWDVIKSCLREGSSDNKIKDMELNDIPGLLAKYPNIKTIFFNGCTCEKILAKDKTIRLKTVCLPSTSPAHTVSYKSKKKAWANITGEDRSLKD